MDNLSSYIFASKPLDADFGVEIEMEGRYLNRIAGSQEILSKWRMEADGSLRNGLELVLNEPIKYKDLAPTLTDLKSNLKDLGVRIVSSDRTGVHLHMNVGHLTPLELVKFLCCYYIVEEVLIDSCGENRIGNHFCLRAVDAEFVIQQIVRSLSSNNIYNLRDDIIRYSALNLCALFRYGSLEFRAIQTTSSFETQILTVAEVLYNIRESVSKFSIPEDVLMEFSGFGPEHFLEMVGIKNTTFLNNPDLVRKCRRGMLLSQDIAYCQKFDEEWNWNLDRKRKVPKPKGMLTRDFPILFTTNEQEIYEEDNI